MESFQVLNWILGKQILSMEFGGIRVYRFFSFLDSCYDVDNIVDYEHSTYSEGGIEFFFGCRILYIVRKK